MSQPTTERRKNVRAPLNVEATLSILFPEETFRPTPLDGTVEDLSVTGLRITVPGVSNDFHRSVIRAVRYAKLTLKLPQVDQPIDLHGRIVWVGYDNQRRVPACSFGIMFEKLADQDRQAIDRFVKEATGQRG